MVATIAQASSAEFYLERQRSYRHPNEYIRGGEEPDGVWWNPSGLFGLADGGRVDSRDFFRLHGGMAPDGSGKVTRNAGNEKRSPGLDLAFNADKTVSALWAIVDDTKTGGQAVPLAPSAVWLLEALPSDEDNPWVIAGRKPGSHLTDLQHPWRRIRARAELDDVRIHDFRHTFASRALALCQGVADDREAVGPYPGPDDGPLR